MSASQRVIGLACQLAVALWIGVVLAWPSDEPSMDRGESTARIQPLLEPPESQTAAAPRPPAARPQPLQPTRVGRAEFARGGELLDGAGLFPALTCSYEDFASFRAYARAMTALGARFVVVRNRRIMGGIDLESGTIGPAALDAGFSPRARDYTDEPGLFELARAARRHFGREAVVMMLVPRDLDAGLFGGIARALAEQGDRHDAYREIRGRYERAAGGGVRLRVDSGVRMDGTEVAMDLLFDLTEIAALGASASGPAA